MNNADSPTLLYLVTEDWYFYKHRAPLASAALEAGYRVAVAAAPGDMAQAVRDRGFEFYPLRMRRRSLNPVDQIKAIAELIALYRRIKPDLVHQVAVKPILYGSLAAKITGVPAVVNAITGLGYVFIGGGLKRRCLRAIVKRLYRFCLRGHAAKTIFQNDEDRDVFIQQGMIQPHNAVIIRGVGVDTERFKPIPEPDGSPVATMVSRMLWDKGVGELVEAARLLKAEGLDFRLVLAGLPDEHNPAAVPASQLEEWRDQGLAEWPGYVKDVPKLLRQSHVVCLPSYREGFPLALLEAAAAGRPIVAADVTGCREIVRHNRNGLLVEPRNAQALAAALRTLLQDRDLRIRMGAEGRKMAEQEFSVERINAQHLQLYAEVLQEARS